VTCGFFNSLLTNSWRRDAIDYDLTPEQGASSRDGKRSLCESLRVSRKRVLQRRVLNLGALNTTQLDQAQQLGVRDAIEVAAQIGVHYLASSA
jgi:hypothetical protein